MDAEEILEQLDECRLEDRAKDPARAYIGGSSIGTDCTASLAFSLRGYPDDPVSPRQARIFAAGHAIESLLIAELTALAKKSKALGWRTAFGFSAFSTTGKQFLYYDAGGHVRCHLDGVASIGTKVYIVELKSANDTEFSKLPRLGLKAAKPEYYKQMQFCMLLSMTINDGLFLAINKNTSELYCELVERDPLMQSYLTQLASTALCNEATKISDDVNSWRCTFCSKKGVCSGEVQPTKECRSCTHAAPYFDPVELKDERQWYCHLHNKICTEVCDEYEVYSPKSR